MDQELSTLRESIDRTDRQLLTLLNERMELVREVGRIKASKGIEFFDPGREEMIYERLARINTGPLTEDAMRSIYREVIAASRMLQYRPGEDSQREVRLKARLCGCLSDIAPEEFPQALKHPQVDLVEWRMDLFIQCYSMEKAMDVLSLLSTSPRHPMVVTYRPKHQGGVFEGPEALRLDGLRKAIDAGAEWVDLEEDVTDKVVKEFQSRGAEVLLSCHDTSGTPEDGVLKKKIEEMACRGVKIIKIATFATRPEDNLRVLNLIPFGRREFGVDVIAFCMGPLGRWSRVAGVLLGSPWTYVQLPRQIPAAPGQFTAGQMRTLLENLA